MASTIATLNEFPTVISRRQLSVSSAARRFKLQTDCFERATLAKMLWGGYGIALIDHSYSQIGNRRGTRRFSPWSDD
jgi:hypothetical protein